jgi:hypothetical protein
MAPRRCHEHRPAQSGFGDDFGAVGGHNSFHFTRNFWLVVRRAVLFGVARERFGGTLADQEGSLLSAMVPISFRGANDDFQGG